MRRLLPARVGIASSPAQAQEAIAAHGVPDLVLLEDRAWPRSDEEALEALRGLSAARKVGLILSRRRGEDGSAGNRPFAPQIASRKDPHSWRTGHATPAAWHPVVERPYDLAEVTAAMRAALLRRCVR